MDVCMYICLKLTFSTIFHSFEIYLYKPTWNHIAMNDILTNKVNNATARVQTKKVAAVPNGK